MGKSPYPQTEEFDFLQKAVLCLLCLSPLFPQLGIRASPG